LETDGHKKTPDHAIGRFDGSSQPDSATFRDPAIAAIPRILPFPEEFFVGHDRLIRVVLLHMVQIIIVIGQSHHESGRLPEIRTEFAEHISLR